MPSDLPIEDPAMRVITRFPGLNGTAAHSV
jgi:hypothetical protein